MENASGDLRRALSRPILGRQLLELTRYAVEEFAELDAHNFQFSAAPDAALFLQVHFLSIIRCEKYPSTAALLRQELDIWG